MTIAEKRLEKVAKLDAILAKAKAESRGFTDAERAEQTALKNEIRSFDEVITAEAEMAEVRKVTEQVVEQRAMPAVSVDSSKDAEIRKFMDYVYERREIAVGASGFQIPTVINNSILTALNNIPGIEQAFGVSSVAGRQQFDALNNVVAAWIPEGGSISVGTDSTGSLILAPKAVEALGAISERFENSSTQEFVNAFVATYANALRMAKETAFWSGTGSSVPFGLAVGDGIDGTPATSNLTISTGSIVSSQLATAVAKVAPEFAYDLVAVLPRNVVGILGAMSDSLGRNLGIITFEGGKTMLNTALGKLEVIMPAGVTAATTAGSVIGVLASKSQYKIAAFDNGQYRYKKLVEMYATSLKTGHLIYQFADAGLGRKGGFVRLTATA